MRKTRIIILISTLLLFLCSCGSKQEDTTQKTTSDVVYFDAVVLQVNETSILVEPMEGTSERKSSDCIEFGTEKISEETSIETLKDIEVGDTIRIGYDGSIAESYPAQISVFEISMVAKSQGQSETEEIEKNTDATEAVENTLVRMVMLNGKIYTDTGEISYIGRCGVMDFSFDSSVEQGEPIQNYQTNFGIGYDGQYGMRDNRIDIYIDDEWHVFAYNENNFDGVTMKVTENTNHSLTLEINNDTDLDVQYGEDYSLEVFDGEIDTWVSVLYLDPDIAFNAIAYVVPKDSPSTWSADWTQMYGELEAGKYRIVKTVNDFRGTGDYTTYTLTAEFEITDETEEGY